MNTVYNYFIKMCIRDSVGGAFGEVSEDELSMLTELCSDAPYLDIIKITANEMDAFLQEKMGISLAETKKTGLDSFYYLEQYDSYYLIMGCLLYTSISKRSITGIPSI